MEKKDTKKIAIIAVAIALIAAVVVGATYAYWQWITSEDQQTAVNVTVAQGINMTIHPKTVTPDKMYPTKGIIADGTTDLDSHEAVMQSTALISIENQTGIKARPKFMLKLRILSGGETKTNITAASVTTPIDGENTYADYIHYAVTENGGDCDQPIVSGMFSEDDEIGTTKWYNSDYITLVDNTEPIAFPILTTGDVGAYNGTVSFEAAPYVTTEHTYKVCVWIDDTYTFTNVGDTISDPLQEATIEVSWSEESEVIQVTG